MLIPIREHVRHACRLPENVLGPSFFEEHVMIVADCSARLAECLHADAEVVELAAYLHDLSAACDPSTLPAHAEAGARLATRLLLDRGYAVETVTAVADAIAVHSAPLQIGKASLEAVCLSNADAAARILRPAYWLYFAFRVRRQPFEEGRKWLRDLFAAQWHDMIEPARKLVGSQYAMTMGLLRQEH